VEAIRDIPAGSDGSYGIRQAARSAESVRAVAQACARMPSRSHSCHRVVRTDGSDAGYSLGRFARSALCGTGRGGMTSVSAAELRVAHAATAGALAARLRVEWAGDIDAPDRSKVLETAAATPQQCARSPQAKLTASERDVERVVMGWHVSGRGEYKYFAYPLRDVAGGAAGCADPPSLRSQTD